jgi:hypothetical protein
MVLQTTCQSASLKRLIPGSLDDLMFLIAIEPLLHDTYLTIQPRIARTYPIQTIYVHTPC